MSPIPSEPLKPKPHEVTLKDGRKLKLKLPGRPPRVEPGATEERGAEEPAARQSRAAAQPPPRPALGKAGARHRDTRAT
jgi:hypothetical protein